VRFRVVVLRPERVVLRPERLEVERLALERRPVLLRAEELRDEELRDEVLRLDVLFLFLSANSQSSLCSYGNSRQGHTRSAAVSRRLAPSG
jgi:hypothetical protein